ncbi:MAG: hypothetical protein UD936_03310, partial [Acutalibacteraceae bacterium]|nr:hypothetical protein [Acutalibacteraceae bacterium]
MNLRKIILSYYNYYLRQQELFLLSFFINKRGCLTNQVRQPDFYAKKEGDFGEEVSKMVYNVV